MAHAGHPASDGPSAKRWMSSEDTGMSDTTAAFVAANCSPFTHPSHLPAEAKVPDTKSTIRTCTAYITEHFQIPVVKNASSLAGATRGDQLIIMNANPLAALPVVWHQASKYSASPLYLMDPGVWNHRYETVGLTQIASQAKALCDQSLKHRVVGAGLKAWVSQDTSISRGTIEGGQFSVAECRQPPLVSTATEFLSRRYPSLGTLTQVGGHKPVGRNFFPTNAGYLGESLIKDDISAMRMCLRSAKTQTQGLLAADKGCTVRWTPTDEYAFTQSVNRNVVVPVAPLFANGVPCSSCDPSSLATNTGVPACRILDRSTVTSDAPDYTPTNWDLFAAYCPLVSNGLGSMSNYNSVIVPLPNTAQMSGVGTNGSMFDVSETGTIRQIHTGALTSGNTADGAGNQFVFGCSDLDYYPGSYIDIGDPAMAYLDEEANFENALYLDISGVDPGQFIDVQVVWHIEYIPKDYAMDAGMPSPIDVNWPAIQAMVSNAEAFPIVVEGHSFFSSLWHGIKKAGGVIGGILRGASSIASAIPDPRAQAFGAGAGVIGGAMGKVF